MPYAQLEGSSGGHLLRLFDDANNELDRDTDTIPNDNASMLHTEVCRVGHLVTAAVTGATANGTVNLCVQAESEPTVNGYWAALGGDAGATFDNFVFSKTYDATAPSDANCPKCTTCTDCCTGNVAGSYILDLGAPGLTTWTGGFSLQSLPPISYLECPTMCEYINGEFVVVYSGAGSNGCTWTYGDVICQDDFGGAGYRKWNISIILTLTRAPGETNCRWRVSVYLSHSESGLEHNVACVGGGGSTSTEVYVEYVSDQIDPADCGLFPVTMTKDTGNSREPGCPCSGTMPNTIVLESAA